MLALEFTKVRSFTSRLRSMRLLLVPALVFFLAGCGEQQLPESSDPGQSRDLMENPLGAAAKIKGAEEAKAKVSAKVAAAREKAAKSDPRGK